MNRLIVDPVVRRICQGILLGFLLASALICLTAAILLWIRADFGLEGWLFGFGITVFTFLSLPYKETLAPLAIVVATAVPVVLSAVCFKVSETVPPTATANLNRTGHIAFSTTLLGMFAGALCLLTLQIYVDAAMVLTSDDPTIKTAVQGLISTIVSFHCVYFLQLLGLQPK